ncbi:MAG: sugar-binding domain-containing protein, partial [Bacteroidota bacterium]
MRTLLFTIPLFLVILSACSQPTSTSTETDFNSNWEFSLDGSDWRPVTLPHDWSVEYPFDSINGEGCTAYLVGGMGKYHKKFPSSAQPVTYLLFDGVYNRATVTLNEQEVGFHPYGYAPIYYDISEQLNPAGQENNLLVEVDRSRYADSRWFTGSGIYREVRLLEEPALHVPPW